MKFSKFRSRFINSTIRVSVRAKGIARFLDSRWTHQSRIHESKLKSFQIFLGRNKLGRQLRMFQINMPNKNHFFPHLIPLYYYIINLTISKFFLNAGKGSTYNQVETKAKPYLRKIKRKQNSFSLFYCRLINK